MMPTLVTSLEEAQATRRRLALLVPEDAGLPERVGSQPGMLFLPANVAVLPAHLDGADVEQKLDE